MLDLDPRPPPLFVLVFSANLYFSLFQGLLFDQAKKFLTFGGTTTAPM